jgi:hypothetical protein
LPGNVLQSLRKQGFFAFRNQDSVIKLSGERFVCYFREAGSGRLYSPQEYIAFQDSWLFYQLHTGYPFASYQCVPDSSENNIVYITSNRQSGPLCLYDSIHLSDLRLSAYFLKKTAGLTPGLPYNEADVQQFRSKMLAVEGYTLSGKAIPSFHYGRFVLNPGIVRQKRDRLSALLGLATQEFYDLFGHGVSVYSRWRRFQARSQELFAGAELPYLLGTPFTTGLHIGLEKYDTVYTRFSRRAVFRFPASRQWRWSIGVERMGVTGLGIDTLYVKALRSLPQNAPSRTNSYLASLEKVNLQTAVFPRQGWSFKVEAGIGSRIWLRDAAISSIVWKNSEGFFENIFDSLQRTGNLRQTTLKLSYSAALHLPVVHSWVLYFSAQGEEYKAPVINFSELSRWGGINSIRGFNEQRIFASSFHMANFELRFMAGQSGFIAPFVSGAVYRNGTQLNMGYRSLYSLGLAGGLKTGAGIMKFAWAMGNEGLGFNLRDAKFHLGLSNVF